MISIATPMSFIGRTVRISTQTKHRSYMSMPYRHTGFFTRLEASSTRKSFRILFDSSIYIESDPPIHTETIMEAESPRKTDTVTISLTMKISRTWVIGFRMKTTTHTKKTRTTANGSQFAMNANSEILMVSKSITGFYGS